MRRQRCRAVLVHHRSENAGSLDGRHPDTCATPSSEHPCRIARHTAALTTRISVTDAREPPPGRAGPGPPSRRPVLRTTEALALSRSSRERALDRGRCLGHEERCSASRARGQRRSRGTAPHGGRGPMADYAALVSSRSRPSYCQPICNEPASSHPATAKRPATNRSFHCHGACNVTARRSLKDVARKYCDRTRKHFAILYFLSGIARPEPGREREPDREHLQLCRIDSSAQVILHRTWVSAL